MTAHSSTPLTDKASLHNIRVGNPYFDDVVNKELSLRQIERNVPRARRDTRLWTIHAIAAVVWDTRAFCGARFHKRLESDMETLI